MMLSLPLTTLRSKEVQTVPERQADVTVVVEGLVPAEAIAAKPVTPRSVKVAAATRWRGCFTEGLLEVMSVSPLRHGPGLAPRARRGPHRT